MLRRDFLHRTSGAAAGNRPRGFGPASWRPAPSVRARCVAPDSVAMARAAARNSLGKSPLWTTISSDCSLAPFRPIPSFEYLKPTDWPWCSFCSATFSSGESQSPRTECRNATERSPTQPTPPTLRLCNRPPASQLPQNKRLADKRCPLPSLASAVPYSKCETNARCLMSVALKINFSTSVFS